MISVIIPAVNAAPDLVRCLTPLVSGLADGLVKEAIVVDGGSSDETVAMAEASGCRTLSAAHDWSAQARAGVAAARGAWLMFLPPQSQLERGWIEDVRAFFDRNGRAATFRLARAQQSALARALASFSGAQREQGLLVARALYDSAGGYGAGAQAHRALLRKLGRVETLRSAAVLR